MTAMTRRVHRIIEVELPPLPEDLAEDLPEDLEALLDEETWAAPERLTPDDCFDHLGSDWRGPVRPHDPEDEV